MMNIQTFYRASIDGSHLIFLLIIYNILRHFYILYILSYILSSFPLACCNIPIYYLGYSEWWVVLIMTSVHETDKKHHFDLAQSYFLLLRTKPVSPPLRFLDYAKSKFGTALDMLICCQLLVCTHRKRFALVLKSWFWKRIRGMNGEVLA